LNLIDFTQVCEINLSNSCLCLAKIEEDLIAVGTQASDIIILSIKQEKGKYSFEAENVIEFNHQ